ncbi:hypothetical protein AVEN_173036-1, partial [Araneus ventricosus]
MSGKHYIRVLPPTYPGGGVSPPLGCRVHELWLSSFAPLEVQIS